MANPFRTTACALALGFISAALMMTFSSSAVSQEQEVYRGVPRLPDFQGQDRSFAAYRTRISDEMRTGPNFAWRYAIVEIGCGTSCRFAYVGDLVTGRVYGFPYGGEEFYMLDLRYNVKDNAVVARWISDKLCMEDYLEWDGASFSSLNLRVVGSRELCSA
ncbi:hypothetical protein [Brevundimonas naejangsanensis]|uniref:hypothetical protein n=1 Tax=Brevundimonas naejangsanensis TaxID=588932 RepID=UPI0026EFBF3F|nr:hypothetical protein [Brevundimonas naejangsanensis]